MPKDFMISTKDVPMEPKPRKQEGRFLAQKTVGGDKLSATTVDSSEIANSAITNAKLATDAVSKTKVSDDAVGGNEWDYEVANITITEASTSGTASVTSGSVPVGYYLTAFTTPTASYVQLVVSGTTLTATLSAAPGAGNSVSIRIILIKL